MAFRANSFKFLWRTVNSKPPTMPFGIVACTFSDDLSRNSCIQFKLAVWRVTHGEPNIGEVSPRNRFIARHSFKMLLSEPLPHGRPHMNAGILWHFEPDFCCSWRAIVVWSNIKHKQRCWINIMIFCIFINLTQVCMLFNIHFQKWGSMMWSFGTNAKQARCSRSYGSQEGCYNYYLVILFRSSKQPNF